MHFTTVTNLMKLKLKRSIEYNLKMHVKLCITNILDLRIKKIKYKIVRIGKFQFGFKPVDRRGGLDAFRKTVPEAGSRDLKLTVTVALEIVFMLLEKECTGGS